MHAFFYKIQKSRIHLKRKHPFCTLQKGCFEVFLEVPSSLLEAKGNTYLALKGIAGNIKIRVIDEISACHFPLCAEIA